MNTKDTLSEEANMNHFPFIPWWRWFSNIEKVLIEPKPCVQTKPNFDPVHNCKLVFMIQII